MTTNYDIEMAPVHGPLDLIDAKAMADACEVPWWNRTLCKVSGSLVRLGVFLGEFHWHKHDVEDELFYVMEGELLLDWREGDVELTRALAPGQAMMVPKGVWHRTRAEVRTVVLMVEPDTVVPQGDEPG